ARADDPAGALRGHQGDGEGRAPFSDGPPFGGGGIWAAVEGTGDRTGDPGERVLRPGQLYEWALAKWGLDPRGIRGRLTQEQFLILWAYGQHRVGREAIEEITRMAEAVKLGTIESWTGRAPR